MGVEVQLLHFLGRDGNACEVVASIEACLHGKPRVGGGRGNEFNHGAVIGERASPPVHRDIGEQPMFDLVPFAGAGREVTDGQGEARLISQALQFPLP